MSRRKTPTRTAFASELPAASATAARFAKVWRAWSSNGPSTLEPSGRNGPCPARNTSSPVAIACEYAPAGAGASAVRTGSLGTSRLPPRRLDHRPESRLEDTVIARPREHEEHHFGDIPGGHHAAELGHLRCPAATHREVGGDAAGTDVRATNAALAQLVVERAGEANLRKLGRAVDGLVREAAAARLEIGRAHV